MANAPAPANNKVAVSAATNHLVGWVSFFDNPLLKQPRTLADVKQMDRISNPTLLPRSTSRLRADYLYEPTIGERGEGDRR